MDRSETCPECNPEPDTIVLSDDVVTIWRLSDRVFVAPIRHREALADLTRLESASLGRSTAAIARVARELLDARDVELMSENGDSGHIRWVLECAGRARGAWPPNDTLEGAIFMTTW